MPEFEPWGRSLPTKSAACKRPPAILGGPVCAVPRRFTNSR